MSEQKRIPLVELFGPTIQGEGAVIGQQTYFLRFGLCDYKCRMCDSMHAVDPVQVKQNAQWLTQDEIYIALKEFRRQAASSGTRNVTFSGGNPCIHDLTLLVHELKMHGWKIIVETQGTFAPKWLDSVDLITISPKGPGMGEETDLRVLDKFVETIFPLRARPTFKVVIFDQRDLEFAKMLYERYGGSVAWDDWYLSLGNMYPPDITEAPPTDEQHRHMLLNAYRMLFSDIQNDTTLSKFKFLPQWHVFVWGNAKGK